VQLALSSDCGISVCIVLKDSYQQISVGLPLVLSQRIDAPFEVIVVDSGSTDGSAEFVRGLSHSSTNLKLVTIEPRQFHHAGTRNFAAALAEGRWCVFLNGDAVPANDRWLDRLTSPVRDEQRGIALSYSRQVGRADVDSNNARRVAFNYGERSLVKGMNAQLSTKERYFFSTVSCCVDTQRLPPPLFPEDLPVNEDMALIARAFCDSFKAAYCADSIVCHSHNYGYLGILRRAFDNAAVFRRLGFFEGSGPGAARDGLDYLTASFHSLRGEGFEKQTEFLLFFFCTAAGALLGKHHRVLPRSLAKRISVYGTV
jgi:rhamnosyltransferase